MYRECGLCTWLCLGRQASCIAGAVSPMTFTERAMKQCVPDENRRLHLVHVSFMSKRRMTLSPASASSAGALPIRNWDLARVPFDRPITTNDEITSLSLTVPGSWTPFLRVNPMMSVIVSGILPLQKPSRGGPAVVRAQLSKD